MGTDKSTDDIVVSADELSEVSGTPFVPLVLIEIVRLHSQDYLTEEGLFEVVQSIDFPHIADVLGSLDALPASADNETLLEIFLDDERAMSFGPNPHFDEAFYQLEYPDIRDSIFAANLHCGFFHYIKYGLREGRWPNRPYKHIAMHRGMALPPVGSVRATTYIELNPMAAAFIASFPFVSPLVHYNALGRKLHLRLQPDVSDRSTVDRFDIIYATIRNRFDPDFYAAHYLPGTSLSREELLSHYIEHAGLRGYSPNALFDEEFYCAFYPEVREAVEAGHVMSGYYHYVVAGSAEGRLALFDLKQALEIRMPGVTAPILLHRMKDLKRRAEPIGAGARFRRVSSRDAARRVWIILPSINPDICFGGYKAMHELIIALDAAGFRLSLVVTEDEVANKRYFQLRQHSERLRAAIDRAAIFTRTNLVNEDLASDDLVISYSVWDLHIAAEIAALTDRPVPYLLVQEYEPIFYDNSSIRFVCESKYAIPHFPIINSSLLETYLRKHAIGVFAGPAEPRYAVFAHKVNRLTPATAESMRARPQRLLALYARPEGHAARNLFEVAVLALQACCAAGDFGPEWRFMGVGALSAIPPIELGNGHSLRLEQKMSEEDYVSTMEGLDIGVSLMFAPHPSVMPFEFATTGALVVTNVYENRSHDELVQMCGNFIPCPASIEGVSAALREALGRLSDVESRAANIYRPAQASWGEIFTPAFIKNVFATGKETSLQKATKAFEKRMRIKQVLVPTR